MVGKITSTIWNNQLKNYPSRYHHPYLNMLSSLQTCWDKPCHFIWPLTHEVVLFPFKKLVVVVTWGLTLSFFVKLVVCVWNLNSTSLYLVHSHISFSSSRKFTLSCTLKNLLSSTHTHAHMQNAKCGWIASCAISAVTSPNSNYPYLINPSLNFTKRLIHINFGCTKWQFHARSNWTKLAMSNEI